MIAEVKRKKINKKISTGRDRDKEIHPVTVFEGLWACRFSTSTFLTATISFWTKSPPEEKFHFTESDFLNFLEKLQRFFLKINILKFSQKI